MYDHKLFADGVHSVLQVEWQLTCKTPLAIRNGKALSYLENSAKAKTRGKDQALQWKESNKAARSNAQGVTESEISSLAYCYAVEDEQVVPYHFVPASSVRGSLRSWTLRHLLHPEYRGKLVPPANDEEEGTLQYLSDIREALADRRNGYEVVASLFGLSADTRDETMPSNAGRLRVETERFRGVDVTTIDAGGATMQATEGPQNAHQQMRVRNPLDRMTHSSKDGGLHHFLEICRGETFTVRMSILNPQDWDIGLLGLWGRELDDGMLRFGALSSIGRGRVSIAEQNYTLWRRPNAPALTGLVHFERQEAAQDGDALSGIFQAYILSNSSLVHFQPYLNEYV